MSQAPAKSAPTCPNCHAAIPRGARACSVCKLEVAKMAGYAAAKKAALTRGIKTTAVERKASSLPVGSIVKAVILLLVVGGIAYGGYLLFKPKPPRYLQYPAAAQDSARKFMTYISAGTDLQYDQAYAMIPDSVRDPRADDERGQYHQIFHIMYLYLSGEFGDNWIAKTDVAPDPADPDVVIVHVGLETLHVRVADQTPADKKAIGPHFGVLGVDEFDVAEAGKFQQRKAIEGVVGGMAGQGAVNNLEKVLNSGGAPRNETPMQKKVRLLPVVGNPHEVSGQAVLNLWPIRKDPVVRNRLEQVVSDGRYDSQIQDVANEVLKDKVTEEELIAAGVPE